MHHIIGIASLLIVLAMALPPISAGAAAFPETITITTKRGFDELVAAVEQAVEKHGLVRIATASASRAAAARGITIAGNAVVLAFSNPYALRLLAASVPAGIEAPMRFYVTEVADGTAALAYAKPSSVLAPYGDARLGELGRELDALFAVIAQDAVGK
jgi:uncharacterized protein (DUF302 family)